MSRPQAAPLAKALALLAALCLLLGLGWNLAVRVVPYPIERLSIADAASLTVVDRNGLPLWRAGGARGERRDWAPLLQIAPVAVQASLAAEDHRFYEHSGVDPLGVLRAFWLNVRWQRVAYGASTISMQLIRLVEPELNTHRILGKLTQALHAARLERVLGKAEILEQYLNRAYYGNGAFGVEAAARLYFDTHAAQLSPGQAAFLAALPRAPTGYDPYRHRARAERRMRHILDQLRSLGWLSRDAARLALDTPLQVRHVRSPTRARHFLDQLLITLPSEQLRGARIESTLDLALQEQLEVATRRHLENIGSRAVTQAGIIVLDNRTGDILAMVGSSDYADSDSRGAVNVTTLPRRAGSTLKPFVYALALERGDSPATLAYDVVLPGESAETYTADVRQHGFARYRESLAGSYNLAAVHTLQRVGVRSLVDRLRLAGVSTLRADSDSYGPDLAIGNAEIRLIDYAGAFAAFGNAGRAVRPRAVRRIRGPSGEPASEQHVAPAPPTVFAPSIAYQIFDILSDPDARRPMFGRSAPLELGFPVALKTGTTRGYTDNLAFGTTREFTVGVWAGNFDGTPMEGVMAMQGAAPLVRAAFVALAARYGAPSAPDRPLQLQQRDVCPLSGERPGPHCPGRKREWFTPTSAHDFDAAPLCSFHRRPTVSSTGDRSSVAFPAQLTPWAAAHDLPDLARDARGASAPLAIVYPPPGTVFQLDPYRSPEAQVPPLQALPRAEVRFRIDGAPARHFRPSPGPHVVQATRGNEVSESEIVFE
jgi:penicillin-binding protein 1C